MWARLFMKYFAQNGLGIIGYIPTSWVKELKLTERATKSLQLFRQQTGWSYGLLHKAEGFEYLDKR